MIRAAELAAVARLELAEVLRSRWALFCLVAYAALGAVFVLVAMRESAVLRFSGTGRVLLSFSHALILLLPLLGLTASGQTVNRAREEGALEFLFSHPLQRRSYFLALSAVRYLTLLLPLLLLLPALAVVGYVVYGEPPPWLFLARALAVGAALLAASVAIGLAIAVRVRNQARALLLVLSAWAAMVLLLDFALVGAMLQWRLNPQAVFALACLNPVQCARMALLAAGEPELAILGPVGFYLANQVGVGALVAIGVAWPSVLAAAVWLLTLRRFGRGDLI